MAAPHEKLAASLTILQQLQKDGRRVFQSEELSRIHRARLVKQGFLQEVIKGWLISSSPGTRTGDSTPWYASFWEFCALYCDVRFGEGWHLSAEQSLLLHAENTVVPQQAIIYSREGHNNTIQLPFGTSLYDLRERQLPPRGDVIVRDGLRIYSAEAALILVPESFFVRYPIETQVVLGSIRDLSALLRRLLDGGHSTIAGRLVGGLRRVGRAEQADEILAAMKAAGYDVRETDPFDATQRVFLAGRKIESPIVGRLQAIWASSRDAVIESFPKPPGLPTDKSVYLKFVDEIYQSDAYHSLSIEGYRVSPELIERVRSGEWDPLQHEADRQNRDALAARGYWQAFQTVKATVEQVISGANPGARARTDHREWYRELFEPCVAAGLIPASALAGYRNDAVYLRTSRYVPPRWETVRDAMPALFDLLETEPEPSVRAVLGHWLFGYIHPYPDGNGRMARFLMNVLLASGGYPWTVIRVEDRTEYLNALDSASIDIDVRPFALFLAKRVGWSPKETKPNGPKG
jgi:fido (protein-threonine AMPylation protein)